MESSGTPAIVPPHVALLTAPQLIGMFINWGLLGVLTVQVYIYYLCFPKDKTVVKYFIYGIYLLEWVQTGLMTSDGFHWFVYGWGKPAFLEDVWTSWLNVPLMGGLISSTIQIFYCWQIWTLKRSIWVPMLVALIAVIQGTAAVTTGIRLRIFGTFLRIEELFVSVTLWHVGEAVADLLIAVTMTYLLLKQRRGIERSDFIVGKIVRMFVQTGMITSTVTILDVILFLVFQHNSLHTAPATILPKLYTNTLLARLNNRVYTLQENGRFNLFNARNATESTMPTGSISTPNGKLDIRIDVRREYPVGDLSLRRQSTDELEGSGFGKSEMTA